MKKLKISEAQERELREELKKIQAEINVMTGGQRDAAKDEKEPFGNASIINTLNDIERLLGKSRELMFILENAEVVKVDMESEKECVEFGDFVSVDISYNGQQARNIYIHITEGETAKGVSRATFDSPIAKSLLGKTVGDTFKQQAEKNTMSFEGKILEIVKAKDLVAENETKRQMIKK